MWKREKETGAAEEGGMVPLSGIRIFHSNIRNYENPKVEFRRYWRNPSTAPIQTQSLETGNLGI
eukprot:gene3208-3513_t